LNANPDTSRPLYFSQLYSVLGTQRIVNIVQNLYARIAADKEEPWLPKAFTRISGWDHHVATQAAFWLDAMGKGKFYHGGEGRLHFHHYHNARHVMTQQGAARWMHHMRQALDESDLGPDPRVRGTIDAFLQTRMEKYAAQFDFQTGDRVYKAWHPEDWVRTDSWQLRGPQPKEPNEPKQCPITGQVGDCAMNKQQISDESTSGGSSSSADKMMSKQQASNRSNSTSSLSTGEIMNKREMPDQSPSGGSSSSKDKTTKTASASPCCVMF